MKTRIAILGYGNLGRGAEAAISRCDDLELVCVFTRRDPADLHLHTPGVPVYPVEQAERMTDQIDVLLLCGPPHLMSANARGSRRATFATQSDPSRGAVSPAFGQSMSVPSAA